MVIRIEGPRNSGATHLAAVVGAALVAAGYKDVQVKTEETEHSFDRKMTKLCHEFGGPNWPGVSVPVVVVDGKVGERYKPFSLNKK